MTVPYTGGDRPRPTTTATGTRAGLFVVFEGGEGSGKSTQVRMLADLLRARGLPVVATREPGDSGDSALGPAIRALLLDPAHDGMSPRCEALLYAADRAEHVARVIAPALDRGDIVICDRYIDSSIAYQGAGRRLAAADIERVSAWAVDGVVPDLTIVLDLPPEIGLTRFTDRDRLESEPLEFHRSVRAAFLSRAARDGDHYEVIDATASVETVHAQVVTAVTRRMRRQAARSGVMDGF